MMYSAFHLNKRMTVYSLDRLLSQFRTSLMLFHVWFHLLFHVASWPAYRFLRRQVSWSVSPISWRIFHSLLLCTQRLYCSWWFRSRCFSGTLLLLLGASGCWQFDLWFLCLSKYSLCIWKFLVHMLLKLILKDFELHVKWAQLYISLNILWHFLYLGLEWKLTFSRPVATTEFSKFAGILSEALWQHHSLGYEIAQLEFHHLH